jgi:hypothetical protein
VRSPPTTWQIDGWVNGGGNIGTNTVRPGRLAGGRRQHWFSPQVEIRPEVTYYRARCAGLRGQGCSWSCPDSPLRFGKQCGLQRQAWRKIRRNENRSMK